MSAAELGPAERRRMLFDEFMRWALGRGCRHAGILRYFGEPDTEGGACGKCDVCERRASRRTRGASRGRSVLSGTLSRLRKLLGG
jgi:hypothetical protein